MADKNSTVKINTKIIMYNVSSTGVDRALERVVELSHDVPEPPST